MTKELTPELAVIALGANLGNREDTLHQAITQLDADIRCRVASVASLIETPPIGVSNQPNFLNSAILLETTYSAHSLLERLQAEESGAGRKPIEAREHWGPRELDLDLIFYGSQIINSPSLIVPHPRMSDRDFVLKPLMEIVPDYRHPILNKTVRELYESRQHSNPHFRQIDL